MSKTRTKSGPSRRSQSPKNQRRTAYRFPVVIEKDEDGYFAACPTLQGCYTQGDTFEDALQNIEEAIGLHVEARLAAGEPLPSNEFVSLTTVEVRV